MICRSWLSGVRQLRWRLAPGVTAALLATVAVLCPTTSAAFTAQLGNSTNSTNTATYFTCAAAATADSAFFAYSLAETSGTTATDISSNGRDGTYQGGATHSAVTGCARDAAGVAVLNGTDAYVSTPSQVSNPQTFTEETWFKTNVAGGKLLGFGSAQTGVSSNYDRHIYLNSAGQLVFGVCPGGGAANIHIVTSPNAYTDNTWHHVAGTFSPTTGLRLYVDGTLVASDASVTGAEVFTGYWRIGFDSVGGWPGAPYDNYVTGSMAFPAVYTAVLSATQVQDHYKAGAPATTRAGAAPAARTTSQRTATAVLGAKPARRQPPKPPQAAPQRRPHVPWSTTRRPRTDPSQTPSPSAPGAGKTGRVGTHPQPLITRFISPTGKITCDLRTTQVACSIVEQSWRTPPSTLTCQRSRAWTFTLPATGPTTVTCPPASGTRLRGQPVTSAPTATGPATPAPTTPAPTTPAPSTTASPAPAAPERTPPISAGPALPVLRYGAMLTNSTFTCTSTRAGMECHRNKDRHGFRLSQAGYTLQPQPARQGGQVEGSGPHTAPSTSQPGPQPSPTTPEPSAR